MSKHVLVVGAGIIGLCTAWHARRKGHAVTVVDQAPGPPHRDGCSFGNAGLIAPSHFVPLTAPGMVGKALRWMANPESPFYLKPRLDLGLLMWAWHFRRAANRRCVERAGPLLRDLHNASVAGYRDLAATHGLDLGLVERGLYMLCDSQAGLDHERAHAEKANRLGVPAEVLTPEELACREPGLRANVVGAVFFPTDCHLPPERLMAALQERLEKDGVGFSWGVRVKDWRVKGRRVAGVATAEADLEADEFAICGGAWAAGLARQLGVRLLLEAGKGYHLTLAHPPRLPSAGMILTEARVAVTPMDGSLRFAGTMELAGLKEGINPHRIRGIVKSVGRYLPDFSPEVLQAASPWFGFRPCSPDGLPYVGRIARWENVLIATGHGMLGIGLGPITGQLVAELISGQTTSVPIELLDPNRYDRN